MNVSGNFVFGLIVTVITIGSMLLTAAGQPGGPLEGQWFVAPCVGGLALLAAFLKREGGVGDAEGDVP